MITEIKATDYHVVASVKKEHMEPTHPNSLLIDLISIASRKFGVNKHSIIGLRVTVESCSVDLEKLADYHFDSGRESKE